MSTGQIAQTDRPVTINTPLGPDKLIITRMSGTEGISRLFQFQLDVITQDRQPIAFDQLLGQPITVSLRLADESQRHFNGIVSRIMEGEGAEHLHYTLEVVPKMWLLTRTVRSRIFQPPDSSVPNILETLLEGIEFENQIQGTFHPRNYCVQYRESDFDFASRLMQEEGIFYFFTHSNGSHKLVLANTPSAHPQIGGTGTVDYRHEEGVSGNNDLIFDWHKSQELTSGKYTLWDYCFEKPDSKLEATSQVQDSVAAGTITHKLNVANNSNLEVYDYPGEYAQRFDGIDKGGGEQPSEIEKIFEDNTRTVGIRMQQEAVHSMTINGAGNCGHMMAGHKFTLANHVNADGDFVLTSVSHSAAVSDFSSGGGESLEYHNTFNCIPAALPFRPPRVTPKPVVRGTHTAVVVGPAGEEIFTDKYGRIKVQFHWDREGTNDAGSSCWIRVATMWAGKQWGGIWIPRIGMEAIIDFQEGDPDRPICLGCVYNDANMPPYKLPDNKTQSGIKSRSSLEGTPDNFNEIRFEDKKGEEEFYLHAEKDLNAVIENNETRKVGFNDQAKGNQHVQVFNNQHVDVGAEECEDGTQSTHVWNDQHLIVGYGQGQAATGNQLVEIWNDQHLTVGSGEGANADGNQIVSIWKDRSTTIKTGDDVLVIEKGDRNVSIDTGDDILTLKKGNKTTKVKLGKSTQEAMQSIELKVGSNSIKIDQAGITIEGLTVKINGKTLTEVKGGALAKLEGGMTMVKGGVVMIN